jgi:hypothetical protein
VTGFLDDPRARLRSDHPLYGAAWIAYHLQDRWGRGVVAEFFSHLVSHWPRARARRSDREERAWTAWFLHDGHGMPLEAIAEAYGCKRDTAQRLARDGRRLVQAGQAPVRVPRVWAPGHEPAPSPPFDTVLEPPPIAFSFDHPAPRAFSWEQEGGRVLVTPLSFSEWEPVKRGPDR